jgi:hypothetical protein
MVIGDGYNREVCQLAVGSASLRQWQILVVCGEHGNANPRRPIDTKHEDAFKAFG